MATRDCRESSEVECMSRPCSDPQYCYCVNYDEHSDYLCHKEDFEVFTPDMTDCARYLNCSDGCFQSVLVSNIRLENQWRL